MNPKLLKWSGLLTTVALVTLSAFSSAEQALSQEEMLERYQHAAEVQNHEALGWFRNENIYPRWVGNSDHFWYDRKTASGKEYILVDATKAKKSPLFDHGKLAKKLAKAAGREVDSKNLLIANLRISLDPKVVGFKAYGKEWRYEVSRNRLNEIDASKTATAELLVSPDGKKGAFLRDFNLWVRDITSGEEQQLTFDGERYYRYASMPDDSALPQLKPDALWSPDSQKIFTVQTDDRQVKDLPMIQYAPLDGSVRPIAYSKRTPLPGDPQITTFRMTVVDVESGKQVAVRYPNLSTVRMKDTPFGANLAWWDDDGKTAYFVDIERGEKTAHFVEFNTDTGATRTVFSETTKAGYLELGSNVYVASSLQFLPETDEIIWYSERSGWAHLYLYDIKTGQLKRQLTSGDWLVRDVLGIHKEKRQLFISMGEKNKSIDPYYRQIARVDIDSGKLTVLSASDADHYVTHKGDFGLMLVSISSGEPFSAFSGFSPTGNYFVETVQRPDRASESVLRDSNGHKLMGLEKADISTLPNNYVWPEPVQMVAADGTTKISGVIYRPRGFDPEKTYPVIDHIYGGPQVSNVNETPMGMSAAMAQTLAELGFVVVVIDGRGTTERSRAFHEASYGAAHTASNLEDHITGIKQLAKRYSYMDTERVGIFGFSGGGYMTANAMLRFPEFFKVGVSGAGNHDQRLFWHSWGERYQGLMEGDNYLPQANLTYAENLKGKLLFIHGLLDYGVHPGGLFQLTQALINANKDFDMVILPQKGHELPGYGLRRQMDYFVENLAGEKPPKEFLLKAGSELMMEKVAAEQKVINGMDKKQ